MIFRAQPDLHLRGNCASRKTCLPYFFWQGQKFGLGNSILYASLWLVITNSFQGQQCAWQHARTEGVRQLEGHGIDVEMNIYTSDDSISMFTFITCYVLCSLQIIMNRSRFFSPFSSHDLFISHFFSTSRKKKLVRVSTSQCLFFFEVPHEKTMPPPMQETSPPNVSQETRRRRHARPPILTYPPQTPLPQKLSLKNSRMHIQYHVRNMERDLDLYTGTGGQSKKETKT